MITKKVRFPIILSTVSLSFFPIARESTEPESIPRRTAIALLGHADGICHIFVDASADLHKAAEIINDSKLQYPAACNAIETLLLHKNIYDELLSLLSKDITIRKGDYDTLSILFSVFASFTIVISSSSVML